MFDFHLMTDKECNILDGISKMVKNNVNFDMNDEIVNFVLNASLSDIKVMFDNFTKFEKMTFRNRIYMNTLHDKCEKVRYKIKDDNGKSITLHKPVFTEKQHEVVDYINGFSGIVPPEIAFNDEVVYAAENQALIAAIMAGQM